MHGALGAIAASAWPSWSALIRVLEAASGFSLDRLRYEYHEYPDEAPEPGRTAQETLEARVAAAVAERWPRGAPPGIAGRIAHKLRLIVGLGYAPYFLTVHEIARFARERGILWQGRGSAANSAVCFALGITAVDPDKHDLRFERFVSADPGEPPDIDIGRTVLEWDKDDIDALGVLKVDLLGLGMLSCLRHAFGLLRAHARLDLDLATLPRECPRTYAMLRRADSLGVFQVESRAQMAMLPRLRPRCFYDLVVHVAIVCPGPIQGEMAHHYLRRRQKLETPSYPSPSPEHGPPDELERVLGKTLGVPLFQEQAMRLAIVAAGFTPEEADRLRRAAALSPGRGCSMLRPYSVDPRERVLRAHETGGGSRRVLAARFGLSVGAVCDWLAAARDEGRRGARCSHLHMAHGAPSRERGASVSTTWLSRSHSAQSSDVMVFPP